MASANKNDPQGVADEKGRLNSRVTSLAALITAYVGDRNGLADLQEHVVRASSRAAMLGGIST